MAISQVKNAILNFNMGVNGEILTIEYPESRVKLTPWGLES